VPKTASTTSVRDEGLLEFRRGRGITVTGTPQQGAVIAKAKELLAYARTQGYKPDELIRIIHRIIQQLG
jgi:GntR family transcriptional regulator